MTPGELELIHHHSRWLVFYPVGNVVRPKVCVGWGGGICVAFIKQSFSVASGLMLLFNLLSFRLHTVFVLTKLSMEVNISGLPREDRDQILGRKEQVISIKSCTQCVFSSKVHCLMHSSIPLHIHEFSRSWTTIAPGNVIGTKDAEENDNVLDIKEFTSELREERNSRNVSVTFKNNTSGAYMQPLFNSFPLLVLWLLPCM